MEGVETAGVDGESVDNIDNMSVEDLPGDVTDPAVDAAADEADLDAVDADGSAAAAAAGGDADKAPWKPSWVRGGGGRGRENAGGRFRGIDPILPVEDPEIIKVCAFAGNLIVICCQ